MIQEAPASLGGEQFTSRQEFWIPKIERNMARDREVNERLAAEGWTVLRFFGKEIKRNVEECVRLIAEVIACKKLEAGNCIR